DPQSERQEPVHIECLPATSDVTASVAIHERTPGRMSMEEMSLHVGSPTSPTAATGGLAPRDLRAWIDAVERIGQLTRIREEVSRNEEMGAITYMARHDNNATTPLF